MKAMILAAGFGKRLLPITEEMPKPLIPILGTPLISYNVELLRQQGVDEIVVNLHHLPDQIEDALGDGQGFGVSIRYSREESILGTGGGLKEV